MFWFICITASLGGLLFGYDTGVIAGALLFIKQDFALSAAMQGVIAAVTLGGAAGGAIAAGYIANHFGRRQPMMLSAALFVLASLLCGFAPDLAMLIAGRLLVGLAIGMASILTPMYLAEIASAEKRGMIVTLNNLSIVSGILLSYILDWSLAGTAGNWRWMLGLGAFPGMLLFAGMMFLPGSPRWLALKGHDKRAIRAFKRLHGKVPDEAETAELFAHGPEDADGSWTQLFASGNHRALMIGVGLAMFQQATGCNAVLYFAPSIFERAGSHSPSAAILVTIGIGIVNVLGTIASLWLVDIAGRRTLLLVALTGMDAMLFLLTYVFGFAGGGHTLLLTSLSLMLYMLFYSVGLGNITWLIMAEIFPTTIRSRAMSLATAALWTTNLVVAFAFPVLMAAIGSGTTFLMFAVIALSAIGFVWRVVPETKGRTLLEISEELGMVQPATA